MKYYYDKNDSSLSLSDLEFPSPRQGVALGAVVEERRRKPVVLRSRDEGSGWDLVPIPEPGISLFFLHEAAGWMVSRNGRLFKTTEAGRSWAPAKIDGVRAAPLRIFFQDEARGWLLCARKQVYSTVDGGRSWQLLAISRRPELPEERSPYTWAAFSPEGVVLLTGWSRPAGPPERFPVWMEPERAPLGMRPTTGIVLHTAAGGKDWNFTLLRDQGEIIRVRISPAGSALALIHRPDSLTAPSGIYTLNPATLQLKPVYQNSHRWVTDIAFLGPQRALAVAIDQEGRTPFPAIPGRLIVLQSSDLIRWTEMPVDYRAEARRAVLSTPGPTQAWVATDTGMILQLVPE